jgi:hypothetical protein
MCVCHTCDNPSCINIDHLFLGTHADNMRDKSSKGRANMRSGRDHPRHRAKITEAQAMDIKRRIATGERQCDIATSHGVTQNLVSEIKLGKTWAWL